MIQLDPTTTAVIAIDLQQGITGMSLAPRTGEDIVQATASLAERVRQAGATMTWVRVNWGPDFKDAPSNRVDLPAKRPDAGMPPEWDTLEPGLAHDGDLHALKHHWGAFTGTDLDLQLRRRGIKTVVFTGIATNMGVESSARSAWELGYDVVILEDLCTSFSAELHEFPVDNIFPRIARVIKSDQLAFGA
ncbi:hydrolase [Larsenimonas suaedae]|uniref:Hydrolase n=1 Tax=Larsenimonas suaedae TaxID=1851019 RepID=A0ABU1GXN9_9GAMM|nr:hydrolase [Larsenimonas suaedae]MCM2973419.1 hydrolase [Larsenimonas suaedae]MDR5896312.1 hydrolase [Larsenimonas suaedae]